MEGRAETEEEGVMGCSTYHIIQANNEKVIPENEREEVRRHKKCIKVTSTLKYPFARVAPLRFLFACFLSPSESNNHSINLFQRGGDYTCLI